MRVLVTGAAGFLGDAVVRAAVHSGHEVVAMVRPAGALPRLVDDRVRVVRGDLRQPIGWPGELEGVAAVIHLAATAQGDLSGQFAGTVVGTENLLAALDVHALTRFVHISSFSVYDFAGLADGAKLDETTPLEPDAARRDAYTATKLIQEQLVRQACAAAGVGLVTLRPGAIYGPGKDWGFGVGLRLGPLGLVFAPRSTMRLTYVDNCAAAVVAALVAPVGAPGPAEIVANIVDDDLPSHSTYFRMCRTAGADTGAFVPVPWFVVKAFGGVLRLANARLWRGRAKFPEFADLRRQQARWKPLAYPNAHARLTLGWSPTVHLVDGVAAVVAHEPD